MTRRRIIDLARDNLGRALVIAAIVGTVLIMINHGDHLENEPMCEAFYAKCALCYVVPFVVAMLSAVLAARVTRGRSGSE